MLTETTSPDEFNGTPNELGTRYAVVGGVKTSPEFAQLAGKIMELRQDKWVEQKRKTNHQRIMRLNMFNWKHGKFSKYRPLPKYFFDYAKYVVSDLTLDDRTQMFEIIDGLIKKNLIRIEANNIFELTDGGVQDKNLSTLMKDTVFLIALRHSLANPQRISVTQVNQINLQVSELPQESENEPLQVIRDALKLLRGNLEVKQV